MYERVGMGVSEIPWYSSSAVFCGGGMFDACVTSMPRDVEWARIHGCIPSRSFFGLRGPRQCSTSEGNPGTVQCCNRGVIREVQQQQEEAEQYGIQTGQRVCEQVRALRGQMRNEVQQAIWDIQDRLCQAGFNPGPVDGTTRSANLLNAIHDFQRQRQIPEGPADAATLLEMGLQPNLESIIALTAIGRTGASVTQANFGVIAAAVGAAGFLGYAVWQYMKRGR